MTYGWRSHLAFNDDHHDAAVVAKSQQQVLNLIVPATTPEEAGDDQAIDPSPQTEERPGGLKSILAANAERHHRHFLFTWHGILPGSPRGPH